MSRLTKLYPRHVTSRRVASMDTVIIFGAYQRKIQDDMSLRLGGLTVGTLEPSDMSEHIHS